MNNLFNQKILAKKAEEEVDLSKHNFSERRKVLNKWINNLENGVLDKSKEEEFQGEFLYDIFTTVLRAVNKSDGKNEWNLERETKTKLDGQKADGVLGFFDADGKKDVRAVIELKGAKVSLDVRQKRTGDTRTPVEQAFNYAPKYGKNCQWVIVSNYKEIRLYRSNDMTEYQVFFLEKLKDDLEFKKFIYILSFYALVGTEKKKAKTIELSEEYQKNQAEIEKKFYNEYKNIRLHIFENMRKNNPAVNENTIIEKVQKLLDRFLFICFCEDKGLLPNEIFYKTLEKGKNFGDVFEVFKMLCNWINLGNPRENISHFNGGLFKNDDVLESLYVDNEVFEEMKKISEYDFDSELNENILGHIFEQSISDIEDLKKELNGEEFDKKKGKRKKDGIFYTPKYITKYIVENSIKNWLDDKRKELGEDKLPELSEADFEIKYSSKKSDERIYSKNYKKHIEFWTKYREAVKNIKIVDPACGSGAFLITAFEYLLNYNNYLNDKIFDLTGTKDLFSDTTREILQNNIFGVDLNKESVEITKLSLWLKTANKNKTLATLENNIKCGNSLIDDVEISGELAFDWEKEFPQVFNTAKNHKNLGNTVTARGQDPLSGFDIVIGNPPYVDSESMVKFIPKEREWISKNYESATGNWDLYVPFIEKALRISNKNSYMSYITPNKWLSIEYGKSIRKLVINNLETIYDFTNVKVFDSADVSSVVFILSKNPKEKIIIEGKNRRTINKEEIVDKENLSVITSEGFKIVNKLNTSILKVKDFFEVYTSFTTSEAYKLKEILKADFIQEEDFKFINTGTIDKYKSLWGKTLTSYLGSKILTPSINKKIFKELYLNRFNKMNHKKLIVTGIRYFEVFYDEKIEYIASKSTSILYSENNKYNKSGLCILNSKLVSYYIKKSYEASSMGGGINFTPDLIKNIPMFELSPQIEVIFSEKADKMLFLNKNLQELSQKFQRMIMRELGLEKISTKLQNWYLLNFDEFIKELSKVKVKLSLSQKADWEDYFIAEKSKAETLNNEITKTDKEIDGMVYELYGLNEEEVRVVEKS